MIWFCCEYVDRGMALTPIRRREKRPYLREWGNRPIRTRQQVEQHWTERPDDNVGLILGPLSGVCDLEFDSPQAGELIERFVPHDELKTWTYGSDKSLHRLYLPPANAVRLGNVLAVEDVELRLGADGQSQSVLPPSIHPSGRPYQWVEGFAPWETDLLPCPEGILEFLLERIAIRNEGQSFTRQERPAVIQLPDGDRPGDLFNASADWQDVLGPHGWRIVGHQNGLTLWKHPHSESGSPYSATTGWQTAAGNDVLLVYSNRTPFKTVLHDHATYTRFEAYTILNHSGDRTKAAARLAELGYKTAEIINMEQIIKDFMEWSKT
jgi:hypothetical protein